ncbi:MAG: carbon starvation protein A, partial [Bacteroidales bacterium]|nr:carbon starvation protein A [Bacteroidales bacterium]
VPMKPWRVFLIQFLNIAGVGPICGAIMGAQFGTASFIWIVFGCIFAGAVHDFISGFISLRQDGASLPEIHGTYLGNGMKQFMRGFTVLLMILVGAVFVNTPAVLLNQNFTPDWNIFIWVGIIFAYYLLATLLPIDKVIGKIYPIFGILLLAMAVAIVVAFIVYKVPIPELWSGMENRHPQAATNPIFPMMFISIACGAISGFHATQSPLMARCMVNEKQCRPIFYGAMITEGVVALIWAAAAAYFFHDKPELCVGKSGNDMVGVIANEWFPKAIAVVCILGVISAAVTSGDTALRSARLIVADFMHVDQKPVPKRLLVALPVFVLAAGLLVFSLVDKEGFQVIWRYFSWANQVLAMVTLWTVTVFLVQHKPRTLWYLTTLVPALFMSMVTISFIFVAQKEGFGSLIPRNIGYILAAVVTLLFFAIFVRWMARFNKNAKK